MCYNNIYRLYLGKDDKIAAVTILQPFVEGILRGVKRVENRKKSMFTLHLKSFYQHPKPPNQTQCRFCPETEMCTSWIHIGKSQSKSKSVHSLIASNKNYTQQAAEEAYIKLGISSTTYTHLIAEMELDLSQMLLYLITQSFANKKC